MPTDFHVDVRGCKLRVRRDGRGEPVLFLHGAQGLTIWEPVLAALAQRFDVIAPDHPGFGRSDRRSMLRAHFEVDRHYVAVAALKALADDGAVPPALVRQAIEKYGIDPDRPDPARA